MPRKKKIEKTGKLEIRYLADGTKIMPIVNGKPIYPEVAHMAGRFERLLSGLASFDPDRFSGEPGEAIKGFIHLARHFCDLYGLDYQDIDRQAHIDYSSDRWDANAKHTGGKI